MYAGQIDETTEGSGTSIREDEFNALTLSL